LLSVLPEDIPASKRNVICIQHPDSAKTETILARESHRVTLLTVGNERRVVHLEDDIPVTVHVAETSGSSGGLVEEIDVT
jgi:hypothetical protein